MKAAPPGALAVLQQGIHHRVADPKDLVRGHPFAEQVLVGAGLRREQQIGQMIRHDPVQFLRHRPVKAAQSRLDVGDDDPQLRGSESGRHRGVDIAEDDHDVGALVTEHRFQSDQDLPRLFAMRARSDLEVQIRSRHAELFEKQGGHFTIIVLAGMDQHDVDVALAA